MKVSIFTNGDNKIGLGHIIRCLALYQAFELATDEIQIIVSCDRKSSVMVKKLNHRILNWVKYRNKFTQLLKNTDIAVIDSITLDKSFYEQVSRTVKLPVFIDDLNRIEYPRCVLINRTLFAEDLNYPNNGDISYLLGHKYLPLTKAFWFVPQKRIRKRIEHILVTFGGSDLRNVTPKILKMMEKYFPKIRKTVVVGRAFNNIEEIENSQDRNTSILYYPTGEILKNIMLDSDLAISAGGQTLYELARVGVPTISVKIADNQEFNINGWKKVDFIEEAGLWNNPGLEDNIVRLIEKMENPDIRLRKMRIGRRFIDGRGSKRIVDFVVKKYKIVQ